MLLLQFVVLVVDFCLVVWRVLVVMAVGRRTIILLLLLVVHMFIMAGDRNV